MLLRGADSGGGVHFIITCTVHARLQVFGGGPVLTANPEPYADFFDVVLLGEGRLGAHALIGASAARFARSARAAVPCSMRQYHATWCGSTLQRAPAGDGEELLSSFTERLLEAKLQLAASGGGAAVPRRELLRALSAVPGVYVPQVGAGGEPWCLARRGAGGRPGGIQEVAGQAAMQGPVRSCAPAVRSGRALTGFFLNLTECLLPRLCSCTK